MTAIKIREFKMCVQECELQYIIANGRPYTQTNRQNNDCRVYTKIDKCLISIEWNTNVDATVTFLLEDILTIPKS